MEGPRRNLGSKEGSSDLQFKSRTKNVGHFARDDGDDDDDDNDDDKDDGMSDDDDNNDHDQNQPSKDNT